jgi:hypothetical protein
MKITTILGWVLAGIFSAWKEVKTIAISVSASNFLEDFMSIFFNSIETS